MRGATGDVGARYAAFAGTVRLPCMRPPRGSHLGRRLFASAFSRLPSNSTPSLHAHATCKQTIVHTPRPPATQLRAVYPANADCLPAWLRARLDAGDLDVPEAAAPLGRAWRELLRQELDFLQGGGAGAAPPEGIPFPNPASRGPIGSAAAAAAAAAGGRQLSAQRRGGEQQQPQQQRQQQQQEEQEYTEDEQDEEQRQAEAVYHYQQQQLRQQQQQRRLHFRAPSISLDALPGGTVVSPGLAPPSACARYGGAAAAPDGGGDDAYGDEEQEGDGGSQAAAEPPSAPAAGEPHPAPGAALALPLWWTGGAVQLRGHPHLAAAPSFSGSDQSAGSALHLQPVASRQLASASASAAAVGMMAQQQQLQQQQQQQQEQPDLAHTGSASSSGVSLAPRPTHVPGAQQQQQQQQQHGAAAAGGTGGGGGSACGTPDRRHGACASPFGSPHIQNGGAFDGAWMPAPPRNAGSCPPALGPGAAQLSRFAAAAAQPGAASLHHHAMPPPDARGKAPAMRESAAGNDGETGAAALCGAGENLAHAAAVAAAAAAAAAHASCCGSATAGPAPAAARTARLGSGALGLALLPSGSLGGAMARADSVLLVDGAQPFPGLATPKGEAPACAAAAAAAANTPAPPPQLHQQPPLLAARRAPSLGVGGGERLLSGARSGDLATAINGFVSAESLRAGIAIDGSGDDNGDGNALMMLG